MIFMSCAPSPLPLLSYLPSGTPFNVGRIIFPGILTTLIYPRLFITDLLYNNLGLVVISNNSFNTP